MGSLSSSDTCPGVGTTPTMTSPNDSNDATRSLETITEAARETGVSRRNILSAAAVGAGTMAFTGTASAMSRGSGSSRGGSTSMSQEDEEDDGPSNVDVLNYALTLEHLENEFYKQGRQDFDDQDLRTAETNCNRNAALNESLPTRIEAIGAHEQAHVDQITAVIEELGGDPVEAACYDFGYETAGEFLGIAQVLENTGVSAYTGALQFFDNDELATAGATIATVEARHASFLNTVNQDDPFPNAFDEAKSMEEIKQAASQFIVECEDN